MPAPAIRPEGSGSGLVLDHTDLRDGDLLIWNAVQRTIAGRRFGYTHIQGVPAAVWTIVHQLGRIPNVKVLDSAGNEWEGDVSHTLDGSQTTVTFGFAFGGTAYLD